MNATRNSRARRDVRKEQLPPIPVSKKTVLDKLDGPVAQFEKKNQRLFVMPRTFGWVKTTYESAIEYTIGPPGARGLLFFWGIFQAGLLIPILLWMVLGTLGRKEVGFIEYFGILVGMGFTFASLCILLWCLRLELWSPSDEPTIFDRKNRKVYRVLRDVHPGLRGLFQRWPLRYASYDWDLIDAQHETKVITTGSTVTRYHALVFLVRCSSTDPTYVDSFTIGSSLILGETTVAPAWEHIRRFMEEDGPHLPSGDVLAETARPHTFWQSLCAIFPASKGDTFWGWLWEELPFALLLLALFPLTGPMYFLWGAGNWLSNKTATPIAWPDQVLQAIGPVQNKR
jgi:hypothetical protein